MRMRKYDRPFFLYDLVITVNDDGSRPSSLANGVVIYADLQSVSRSSFAIGENGIQNMNSNRTLIYCDIGIADGKIIHDYTKGVYYMTKHCQDWSGHFEVTLEPFELDI